MIYEAKKVYETNKNAYNTLDDLKKIFCICEGSSNPKRKSFLLRKKGSVEKTNLNAYFLGANVTEKV